MSKIACRMAAVLMSLMLVASACGGDDSTGKESGTTSKEAGKAIDYAELGLWNDGACDASKPKLKIGLMTVFASPVISLESHALALKAAAEAFNERGGANGHCIEVRINAEKIPNFSPCPGRITQFHSPGGLGVRMDSAIYDGYRIPPYYDSLIGKLIVHGRDRPEALARLKRALSELIIDGIDTSIPLFHMLLDEPDIQNGDYNIHWLEKWLAKQFA
jgi:hypothetical protein